MGAEGTGGPEGGLIGLDVAMKMILSGWLTGIRRHAQKHFREYWSDWRMPYKRIQHSRRQTRQCALAHCYLVKNEDAAPKLQEPCHRMC